MSAEDATPAFAARAYHFIVNVSGGPHIMSAPNALADIARSGHTKRAAKPLGADAEPPRGRLQIGRRWAERRAQPRFRNLQFVGGSGEVRWTARRRTAGASSAATEHRGRRAADGAHVLAADRAAHTADRVRKIRRGV